MENVKVIRDEARLVSESIVRPILADLISSSPDIQAAAVMSRDGLIVASILGKDVNTDRLGAMCSTLLSLAERIAAELQRGGLKQLLVHCEEGHVLVLKVGDDALLAVVSRATAHMGMVLVVAKKTADQIIERCYI